MTGNTPTAVSESALDALMRAWFHEDGFAESIAEDPRAELEARGVYFPDNVEFAVVRETERERYMAMPPNPNVALADESLSDVAGGSCGGSASTLGSASTAGSICTCLSTASSAACAGSASSAS